MAKKIDIGTLDIKEKVVTISRVAKVVRAAELFASVRLLL